MAGTRGRSGRRPLPTAVKKLRGNRGRRPLNEAEPVPAKGEPVMPTGLPPLAVAEWRDIVPELKALGVLARLDGKALAAYCCAFAHWMKAEADIGERGLMIETPIVGKDRKGNSIIIGERSRRNPAVDMANEAMRIMKAFLVEFGMTPSSRSRLRVEKPAAEDPLDAFLKRAAAPSPARVQ